MHERCKKCNKNVYRKYSRASYFAETRSTQFYTLNVYPCPHGKGFHVSKWREPFTYRKGA